MDDLVRDAVADLKPHLVEFSLDEFREGNALWAANFFVLWPLGLALTVDVEVVPADPVRWCGSDKSHSPHPALPLEFRCEGAAATGAVTNLHVRHWEFPVGELGETIDLSHEENSLAFHRFLAFVHRRVLALKPEERKLLLERYDRFKIAGPEQILLAVDP